MTAADGGIPSEGNCGMGAMLKVALLTGGQDRHYAVGLATALAPLGIFLEVVGSDEVDGPEWRDKAHFSFLNLRGEQRVGASAARKIRRILAYYGRLVGYAVSAKPKIFHILWNNKFEFVDRVLLMLCYKAFGKKTVLTAHNVNQARRDRRDGVLNRLTLRVQYRLSNHIFVHTEEMKREMRQQFGVPASRITVIPYGINNAVPDTALTGVEARKKLGITQEEKTVLFFGAIAPYKGLHLLVPAFLRLAAENAGCRLIIAGKVKGGCEKYLQSVRNLIDDDQKGRILLKIKYIPDEEIEMYFKAADVLALPYTEIFQSGILFLGYSFGLPVVAADVGSFREDVVEGRTGFLCRPDDAADLARNLARYFASDLYRELPARRQEIRSQAAARHSWNAVAEMTRDVYGELLEKTR